MKKIKILPGKSFPIGATVYPEGVNFCIFSKNAVSVELLLFDSNDHSAPTHVIELDPNANRTFYYWHAFIPGLKAGQVYAYRAHGPFDPEKGFRFDSGKVLIDPYARGVVMDSYDRQAAMEPGDNCAQAIKSVVIDPTAYDWEGDQPLKLPFAMSVIYELHVGGFTKDPSSGVPEEWRGTFRGLIEKIPYLKKLGITSVELLPVQQFDPFDVPNPNLVNYWGYSPIAFFAPHNGYCSCSDPVEQADEFRDMVKALHRAGIEVILDVVFNHTAEGNHEGPVLSLKGLENGAYYMLKDEKSRYFNFSGTGNTINANHSIVRRMIIECLRYWVCEMHVDGFRFDLASILSRDEKGKPIANPPILWQIESDPMLAPAKIIAEAWDVGQYQLGSFIGDKWAEWNGMFRDDVRRFLKGDDGTVGPFSQRILGSPDLFGEILRDPNRSINFVTCHDGFTLNDLVSYNQKHNWANGEGNLDGHNANFSWNCGVEGPTEDPVIERLRLRQIKNYLTLLMISKGTPMLLMGDEVRRTQSGNNNAYCHDNEISWFDWKLTEKNRDLLEFVRQIIRLNMEMDYFQEDTYWHIRKNGSSESSINFHGVKLWQPDWSEHSHTLAFTLNNPDYSNCLHIMINTYWEALDFDIPKALAEQWRRIIDTYLPHPEDILDFEKAPVVKKARYRVEARSVAVLMGEKASGEGRAARGEGR
jgi:isoamylase